MRAKSLSSEVLVDEGPIVRLTCSDVNVMKQKADETERARIRLCTHASVRDRLHEMFIVHKKDTYIRPHKHPGKSESAHIIEGLVTWVAFDDSGNVTDVIRMGDYRSGHDFYYRLSAPRYHTLLIHSDWAVFHEITNGPFDAAETVFAPWSPENGDLVRQRDFMEHVASAAEQLRPANP